MATYNYRCNKCTIQHYIDSDLSVEQVPIPFTTDLEDLTKENYVFTVSHGMSEKPKIKCPVCKKTDCDRSYNTERTAVYTRGNYIQDTAGCKLEQELSKLRENDPYGHMRQPGEADDLEKRLLDVGKRLQNRKHGRNMEAYASWDVKEQYIAQLKLEVLEKKSQK